MRTATALALAALLALAVAPSASGQSTASPPPFAAGPAKLYAHATADSLTVWMNALVDDGGAAPYYLYGAPAVASQAGQTPALEPVANQAFEARIPLSPALAQDLVLEGTVTVQAYIGGGTYTAGTASIGTSLVAGGAEVGAAAAKTHQMTPKQAGQTYDPISWTFDVEATTIPAGTTLEWVLKGTGTGNNLYLAAHEARGRSFIELPVASASAMAGDAIEHQVNGTTARFNLSAAAPTNASHVYSWTTNLTAPELRIAAQVDGGNVTLLVLDGANATLYNTTVLGNVTKTLKGAAGNWTFRVEMQGFRGNVTVEVGPPLPTPVTSSSGSTSRTSTNATASASSSSGDAKDTPSLAPAVLLAALAALASARRRRA